MGTSHSYKLESHPGRPLIHHLANVGEKARKILSTKSFTNETFRDMGYLYGVCHDFAKSTTYFQNYLHDTKHKKTSLSRHGLTSAVFTYLAAEYVSQQKKYAVYGYLTVAHHHGNLKNFIGEGGEQDILSDKENQDMVVAQTSDILKNNIVELEEIYKKLCPQLPTKKILQSMSDPVKLRQILKGIITDIEVLVSEENTRNYIDELLFFSSINDCDKLHASQTETPPRCEIPEDFIQDYKKKFKQNPLNKMRSEACAEVLEILKTQNNPHQVFTLTLPTGMGKTLTGLEAALELRNQITAKKGYTPKIIYSLPFLSIIEQNSRIIENMLSDKLSLTDRDEIPSNLFLKHHHLTDDRYSTDDYEWEEDGSDLLTTAWYSEIIVTTFYQLFHTLITNKNRMSRKFHNIVDSIIILDEIQAIPYKYWHLFEELMLLLVREYGCCVILMTATQPLLFKNQSTELTKNTKKYYQNLDRVDYHFNLNEQKIDDYLAEKLPERLNSTENMMFVVNTIKSSQLIYREIKKFMPEGTLDEDGVYAGESFEVILLNTGILPEHRLKKIQRIMAGDKRKMIVSTQLIEAGVDISVDRVIRDMSPLDSIIQAGGRCNRNNTKRGVVEVILLKDDNKKLSSYIYNKLLLDVTMEVLQPFENPVKESCFTLESTEEYYTLLKTRSSNKESREIIENIRKLDFQKTEDFRLIKDMENIQIYLEIDDAAKKTLSETIKKIQNPGPETTKRILKAVNKYTIKIIHQKNKKKTLDFTLNKSEELGEMYIVPQEKISKWYTKEQGFMIPEDVETDARIL